MNLHSITVSACRGAFDRNTYEVNLLDWLENVRPSLVASDYAKKQLPAIMPHGVFATRRQDTFQQHSGIVQIDIDGKHQTSGFNPDRLLNDMQYDAHVLAAGKSCGGNGIYLLLLCSGINADNHRKVSGWAIDYIEMKYSVRVDDPVSTNLSSLRFASYYAPFINMDVTPFNAKS